MTVITVKDQSPTEQLLSSLQTWQRDAKKFKQTALYDLLAETVAHIKKQEKALNDEGKKVFEEFTRSEADAAFSDYIRARAGYRCERCGKQYKAKSNGLQCSHHFSRRHYNIRFDPDNAAAASSLSQVLETQTPQKYFLSDRAKQGILERARKRGKTLPPLLKAALELTGNPPSAER